MTLIDRERELALFQEFQGSVSKPWLLAIYGLNGLGKTSLLTRFSDLVNTEYQVAFVDFSQKNLCEDHQSVIEILAGCLAPVFPARKLTQFQARLREIGEGQKVIAQNTIIARYNSIINTPKQNINVYLNQENGRQQLEDGRDMARAWCQLLASAKKKPLLILDHWEMLAEHGSMDFCSWMIEDILIKSHAQNSNLKVVLASDHSPLQMLFWATC
jgi:AAA+ ATPase superfamily predicted ATPase